MALCLVTGGAGFIGSHLVEALVVRGERVRVLDNLSTGNLENLKTVINRIEFVKGDITDLEIVREVMEGVDCVFHQAALPSVARSIEDPLATHRVNATGTLNVLIAARDAGARRVVYASSSSVYGETPEVPKKENMATIPHSPYAVSKLAGENYCRAFWESYKLPTVCLRYFNVYGPRQPADSPYAAVIPKFLQLIAAGEPLPVYGTGSQTRDFTYVSVVVEANLQAAILDGIEGEVFNVGTGSPISISELVSKLQEITGLEAQIRYLPPRPGDIQHSWADISKAVSKLGLVPLPLQEGLYALWNHIKRHPGEEI